MGQFQARGLTNPAADSVAFNSFAQSSWCGETHARSINFVIGETKSGEVGTGVPRPVIINFSEIAGAKKPYTFGKA
jgi:hypothetical protein